MRVPRWLVVRRRVVGGHSDGGLRERHRDSGVLPAYGWPSARCVAAAARALLVAWSMAGRSIGVFYYPAGDWNGAPRDVDRPHVLASVVRGDGLLTVPTFFSGS